MPETHSTVTQRGLGHTEYLVRVPGVGVEVGVVLGRSVCDEFQGGSAH